jgi:hypothetical protein
MNTTKKFLALAVAAFALTTADVAQADVTCPFVVATLGLTPDGWFSGSFYDGTTSKNRYVCNVAGSTSVNDGYSSKTITSDTCKALYSQMLTFKMSNKQPVLGFHGPTDCSTALNSSGNSGTVTLYPTFGGVN